jgi:hypothetical protein
MEKFTPYHLEAKIKQQGAVLILFLCLLSLTMSSMFVLWQEYLELRQWLFDLR